MLVEWLDVIVEGAYALHPSLTGAARRPVTIAIKTPHWYELRTRGIACDVIDQGLAKTVIGVNWAPRKLSGYSLIIMIGLRGGTRIS